MMMLLMRRRMKLYFHPSRSVRLDNVQMLLAARGRLPHTPGHWSIKATDVRQPPPMPSECSLHNAGGWDSKEGPSGERVSQLVRRPYRDPGVCTHPFRSRSLDRKPGRVVCGFAARQSFWAHHSNLYAYQKRRVVLEGV